MLSLKAHNIIDYLVGALLILSPWVFGFSEVTQARVLFLAGGFTLIAYSLVTNYYYSVARLLPLGVHMTLDSILGVLLMLAPALFGYRGEITRGQFFAHIILGIGTAGFVALTAPRTESEKSVAEKLVINQDLRS